MPWSFCSIVLVLSKKRLTNVVKSRKKKHYLIPQIHSYNLKIYQQMSFLALLFLGFLILASFSKVFPQKPCIKKFYPGPEPRMVCVCNSTYCDEFPPLGILNNDEIAVYVSSMSGKRFEKSVIIFESDKNTGNGQNFGLIFIRTLVTHVDITILEKERYQKVIGFGGAFTDAVGVNLNQLSREIKENLLNAYFGKEGKRICRKLIF